MTEETPVVVEHDCSTGETITRPMNEEELAAYIKIQQEGETARLAAEAEAAAVAAAKEAAHAKLAALGLSADEIAALSK